MMVLQRLAWPRAHICAEERLYLHAEAGAYFDGHNQRVMFLPGSFIEFCTYFNIFSAGKWSRYTSIKEVALFLSGQGRFIVRLWQRQPGRELTLLWQECLELTDEEIQVSVTMSCTDGVIWFDVRALEKGWLAGGSFRGHGQARKVVLGMVVCTYQRPHAVRALCSEIAQAMQETPELANTLHLVVVDQGGLLQNKDLAYGELLRSPNLGGSGGYTRGLLWHAECGEVTHVVFCDDDVRLDAESLRRLAAFYSLCREEEDIWISGAMLVLERPHLQWENGAVWRTGHYTPNHHARDLCLSAQVLANELVCEMNYGGWFLFAFPIAPLPPLPMPFFISCDDIEFSLGGAKKLMTLNGVCVWHQDHGSAEKRSDALGGRIYYLIRNTIITSLLHEGAEVNGELLWYIIRAFARSSCLCFYGAAELITTAMRDVLRGPHWLATLDMAQHHQALKSLVKERLQACEAIPCSILNQEEIGKAPPWPLWAKVLFVVTANGHLLPSFLLRSPSSTALGPEMSHEGLLRRRMTYISASTATMLQVEHNKRRFFLALWRFARALVALARQLATLRCAYRSQQEALRGLQAWRTRLDQRRQ